MPFCYCIDIRNFQVHSKVGKGSWVELQKSQVVKKVKLREGGVLIAGLFCLLNST